METIFERIWRDTWLALYKKEPMIFSTQEKEEIEEETLFV